MIARLPDKLQWRAAAPALIDHVGAVSEHL
jgi:hypothetical protein